MKPRYLVNSLLSRWDYAVVKLPAFLSEHRQSQLVPTFDMALGRLMLEKPKPFFVQVGAFRPGFEDYLHRHTKLGRLGGLMIEPQPKAFEELNTTYADREDVILVQAAISDHDGEATLYIPNHPEGKDIASLSRDHAMLCYKERPERPDPLLFEEKVPLRSLDSLFTEHHLESFDILQIDAEGHDDVILQSVDLKKYQPAIISLETCNISRERRSAVWSRLDQSGYRIHINNRDTLALHESYANLC